MDIVRRSEAVLSDGVALVCHRHLPRSALSIGVDTKIMPLLRFEDCGMIHAVVINYVPVVDFRL